nr:MAG TPA: hypothetical protein [Caudoviricetes sp.]
MKCEIFLHDFLQLRYRNSASKTLTRATQSIMFSCSQLHTADMATGGVSPFSLRSLMSRDA